MARAPKPDPSAIYVARESVSISATDTINAGERRRGDDPLVVEHFRFWAQDGERIPAFPASFEPPPRPKVPEYDLVAYEALQPVDGLVLTRPLRVLHQNKVHRFERGTVFARDSELVRLAPDAWVATRDVVKR